MLQHFDSLHVRLLPGEVALHPTVFPVGIRSGCGVKRRFRFDGSRTGSTVLKLPLVILPTAKSALHLALCPALHLGQLHICLLCCAAFLVFAAQVSVPMSSY